MKKFVLATVLALVGSYAHAEPSRFLCSNEKGSVPLEVDSDAGTIQFKGGEVLPATFADDEIAVKNYTKDHPEGINLFGEHQGGLWREIINVTINRYTGEVILSEQSSLWMPDKKVWFPYPLLPNYTINCQLSAAPTKKLL